MSFNFDHDEEGMKLLAVFVAQLVREGVKFKISQSKCMTTVELTGGF